jgi:MFS family permease
MVAGAHPIEAAAKSEGDEAQYPGLKRAWWLLILLFLSANLYSIDKAVVGVLAEPIRTALVISDVQMSLLLGLAYTMLSVLLGLVLGNFTDHHSRRRILAFSIILWSLATMAGGLATNFSSFFVFRALVGLGEAGLAPTALSVIADIFPPRQRGRALSGYFIGATMGTALSSVIPGWIIAANLHLTLPLFGVLEPWRVAFLVCGAVGPVVGILFLTTPELPRQGMRWAPGEQPPIREKLGYLWQRKAMIVPLYAGFCLYYIAFVGITAWTTVFLMRTYDAQLPDFAGRMGVIAMISGTAGYLMGGMLSDSALGRRGGGKLALLSALPIVALPGTLAVLMPNITTALIALAAIAAATPMVNVAMNATMQELLPNDMRGFSYSLLAVVSALPAGAGGPLIFAVVTEHFLGDPARIGTSFMIVGVPSLLLSSICFLYARRTYRRSLVPQT